MGDKMTKYRSWFWYGRFEGFNGGYVPPDGVAPRFLYWCGNVVGRVRYRYEQKGNRTDG